MLQSVVQIVLNILDQGDFCVTLLLIGVLVFLGNKLVTVSSAAKRWGQYAALAALLAYCVYGLATFQPDTADAILGIVFRGFLAAGLTLGPAWIVLAILSFFSQRAAADGLDNLRRMFAQFRLKARDRQALSERQERDRAAQRDFDRTAPERERARQEAEAKAREIALAQRRREDARSRCLFFFALHGPEIAARFTKEMFDGFVAKYMAENHPPEYVEERGQQLEALMQQHLAKSGHASHQLDMAELTTAYERQREQLLASNLDERLKQTLLANLRVQFTGRIMRQTEE